MYKTGHKKLLVDIFSNNKEKSYTAIALVDELSSVMNKATIYRQLQSLEKENIIRKVYNNENNIYEYQYFDDCDNHFHLKCVKCGRIKHLDCDEAKLFLMHIYDHHGFKINQASSTIYGICKECV